MSIYARAVQPVATCRHSPYLHKPAVVILTSFSLWRLALAAPILITTLFATELAVPTVTDVRTDTLLRLIYKGSWSNVDMIKSVVFMLMVTVDYCRMCWALLVTSVVSLYIPETVMKVVSERGYDSGRSMVGYSEVGELLFNF